MEVVYQRCCGLDVHKDKIVACVINDSKKEIRSYGTVTESLIELVDWLKEEGCENVAMESTGSYWKPIYNLLELEEIPAMVVNAQHIKAVPGRKTDELKRALKGLIGEHQKKILSTMLRHIDFLDAEIEKLDAEVKERMRPFEEQVKRLDSIAGVGERSAQTIIAEIGTDMSVFPTANHLASWAGMCPGNNESAGKKKSGKTRKGSKSLRSTLVECAKAASRSKNSYLSAQYKRIAARRGRNRATVAVGHSILVIVYHLIKNNVNYQELGTDYFEQRRKQDIVKRSIKRLEALGLKVTVEEQVVA